MVAAKSAADKMGVKEGSRAIFIAAPEDTRAGLELPDLHVASRLTGYFDYIHFFTKTQKDLDRRFSTLRKHLGAGGMLWVSWPKAGKLDTDLNIKTVIRIGYSHGMVESKAISLDMTWSALKFTHPKAGKTYVNSFGALNRLR